MNEKRTQKLIENIVAWSNGTQPTLKDEPQAYKAAMIRLGTKRGIKSILNGGKIAPEIIPILAQLIDELEQIGYISHKRTHEEMDNLLSQAHELLNDLRDQ